MYRLAMVLAIGIGFAACLTARAQAEDLKVGDKAPDFKATSTDGKTITLATTKGADATVLCFHSHECPVAIAYEGRFNDFVNKYSQKNVKFIALNCNNRTEDLEEMKEYADEKDFKFTYAFDETAQAAAAYNAIATPHLFVIDRDGNIAYMGAFDDAQNKDKVTKTYVVDAVNALLAGEKPKVTETRAFGCTLKIKK